MTLLMWLQMACSDMKSSLDDDCYDGAHSSCAAAMEKGRDSYLSPTENPSTISVSSSVPPDQQGYDVEFDPPLENKYECPICLMGLRSAVQTPCGHRFCNSCIRKSIRLVHLKIQNSLCEYLICKLIRAPNYQCDLNFAAKPAAHYLLHSFIWLVVFTFLVSKRALFDSKNRYL